MRSWSLVVLTAACVVSSSVEGQDATRTARKTSSFHDRSPHFSRYVRSGGARIHTLEWSRGAKRSRVVVLLPGYSLTAHVYDEVAPLLADSFRVIAVTPRGFGESDAPDSSTYSVQTLVDDLQTVLDSLGIARATLVGHSLSGSVAASFALQYPGRVERIALLDAFPYAAQMKGDSVMSLDPVSVPAFRGDTTYDRIATYLATYRFSPWSVGFENDLHAKPLGREAARRRDLTAAYVSDQWKAPPDVARLTMPALEVCAVASVHTEYPWLARNDSVYARAASYVSRTLTPYNDALCHRFANSVPGGRVVRVEGSHYVFFSRPAETARLIRAFAFDR